MDRLEPSQSVDPNAASLAQSDARTTRELFKIASFSTALAFGCATASLQALDRGPAGFGFNFTLWTPVAFLVGATIGVLFWRVNTRNSVSGRRSLRGFLFLGLAMFLYPLRFIASGQMRETLEGLIFAACAVSGVVFMLWQVKLFLDSDTEKFEADLAAQSKQTSPIDSTVKSPKH